MTAPVADEIPVSPAMVEAGNDAFWAREPRDRVAGVYRAMERVRRAEEAAEKAKREAAMLARAQAVKP